MMNSIAWWPTVVVMLIASGIDLYCRRIPNWLVLPFLAAGPIVLTVTGGLAGLGRSGAGIAAAVLLFGLPCLIRAMGMGDLKLAAAAGGWIGPGQMFMAFVVTGIVGGVIAIGYALSRRSLGKCFDNTANLLEDVGRLRIRRLQVNRFAAADALAIPYAPAIALGTLFSFFGH